MTIPAPTIASFDRMQDMVPFMLNGTYNPGQLKAVREILYADGPDFDTARFTGNLADYTIDIDDERYRRLQSTTSSP